MTSPAASLENVTFRYLKGAEKALDRVSMHVDPGETVAVIGITGAGKSTLLRCLNRLVPASYRGEFSGRVSIFGRDASDKKPAELASAVGMVFQDFESQLFSTTAIQDVAFGPENLGLEGDALRERIEQALAAVGILDLARRDPATLSGGQKQRLAIASVLALDPRLFALDEPVTDLDPRARREVVALVKKMSGRGVATVIAEHEWELLSAADRFVVLDRGRKAADEAAGALAASDLAQWGVRPPDVASVFQKLGLSEKPDTPARAARLLADKGYSLKPLSPEQAPARTGAQVIRCERLEHVYPTKAKALNGVDLSVNAGEFVAVLGENGSGKTTLVKHLNGLLRPSAGAVYIDGQDAGAMKTADLGRRVGFVFQDPDHQIFAARVFDEVAFAPRNHGLDAAEVKRRVGEALEAVGLGGRDDRDPFLLTKGERQRVALASVLAAQTPVIIMDEPTTGLDYQAQRAVMDLLRELNRGGRAVIVVTHAVWVAAEYASRCLVMKGGLAVADGPTREVLADRARLESAGLAAPAVTEMALEMGAPLLAVGEFLSALERRA